MKQPFDLRPLFDFLNGLKAHNNKDWFDKHRADYENARSNFEAFVDAFISEFRATEDLGAISAKDCTFRINRDIRFSKDKTPYKTNVSANVARGGRKSVTPGYYISLAPQGESILAGGLHMPTPAELGKLRQAIDRDASPLKRILRNPRFVHYYGTIEGERVKSAPQGYARDHPEIELLRMKQMLAVHHLSDRQVLASDLLPYTVDAFRALKPFTDYLNSVIH